MATVIAKNNLGSNVEVEDLGISFTSNEIIELTDFYDFVDLTESESLRVLVGNASITINDGSNDLSIAKGLEHLEIESVHLDFIQDEDIDGGGIVTSIQAYSGVVTSTQFQMTSSYVTTPYITLEYENDSGVIEWDGGSRITVKEDGDYRVSTDYFVRVNENRMQDSWYRIIKNGGTVLYTETRMNTYETEIQQVVVVYTVPLLAGDYLETQCRCTAGIDTDIMESRLNITKTTGVKGDTGPPGGSTVVVQSDGVVQTTSTALVNFRGNGVTVSPSSATSVNVDIVNNAFEPKYVQVYNSSGGVDVNTTTPKEMAFNVQEIRDTDTFNHSTTANNSRVYVLKDGWYETSYNIVYDGPAGRTNVRSYVEVNDNTLQDRTISTSYTRDSDNDLGANHCGAVLISLNAGDYVEVKSDLWGDNGSCITIANQCWLMMKLVREG